MASLLQRNGRTADATLMLDEIVNKDPANVDALLALADSQFEAYRKTGNQSFMEKSRDYADQAKEAAPQFWRTRQMSGLIALYGGDPATALAEFEQAVKLDANELVLVNLGTLQFCTGKIQQARHSFLAAQKVADDLRLGEENLGAFEYYLGNYGDAVRYRRQAIEALGDEGPSIHQVWGDLGDAYRRAGQPAFSAQAYSRALAILEADGKTGNAVAADKTFRAYYLTMTQSLDKRSWQTFNRSTLVSELEIGLTIETDPAALLRAAIAWRLLGNAEKSALALQKASKTCVVYKQHPDLQE
jgi:tetratricopeptide (TPR) repeat protein